MSVDFRWDNDEQTVIRFVAEGVWNWNDFHKNVRRATFWFDSVKHPVETIIDLRGTTKLPAGAMGHIRSLGKRIHPHGRDRVVIIGLDKSIADPLGGADRTYHDSERLIRFVDTDVEAQAIITQWITEN
jgi:hypothetical protein